MKRISKYALKIPSLLPSASCLLPSINNREGRSDRGRCNNKFMLPSKFIIAQKNNRDAVGDRVSSMIYSLRSFIVARTMQRCNNGINNNSSPVDLAPIRRGIATPIHVKESRSTKLILTENAIKRYRAKFEINKLIAASEVEA